MLGDRGDTASRLLDALSTETLSTETPSTATTSTETPSTEPPSSEGAYRDDVDRYRAVVSALLDVRPDHVEGYFDEVLDAALAATRVDVHLARTLRWWQRASVRAAEDFVARVIPTVMAALDDADIAAERDAAANATAWQQAQAIAELNATTPSASASDDVDATSEDESADVTWKPPMRLVAVPDLPATPVRRRPARTRAVRLPDFDAPVADVSIDEIDSMLTFEREEPRRHAHPASSA